MNLNLTDWLGFRKRSYDEIVSKFVQSKKENDSKEQHIWAIRLLQCEETKETDLQEVFQYIWTEIGDRKIDSFVRRIQDFKAYENFGEQKKMQKNTIENEAFLLFRNTFIEYIRNLGRRKKPVESLRSLFITILDKHLVNLTIHDSYKRPINKDYKKENEPKYEPKVYYTELEENQAQYQDVYYTFKVSLEEKICKITNIVASERTKKTEDEEFRSELCKILLAIATGYENYTETEKDELEKLKPKYIKALKRFIEKDPKNQDIIKDILITFTFILLLLR